MNSRGKIEKWLLADWSSGRSNVDVTKTTDASIIAKSERRCDEEADAEGGHRDSNISESASGTANNHHQEGEDYSPSASSWAPTDGSSSSEDSDTEIAQTKTVKMEKYIQQYIKRRNGKKKPLPVHRPNAVVNVLQERQIFENNRSLNDTRKRKYQEALSFNKSLPDSTRKNIPPAKDVTAETININKKEILEIKASFEELFKMLNDMKPKSQRQNFTADKIMNEDTVNVSQRESRVDKANVSCHSEHSNRSQSEESNRSDDNVLITNKYHKARISPENQTQDENEWVPIGSGKTLIHKDKYRKVNWKSYTIATRTLLLATFPRRILATHSLTGKRSPAFLNKPAKMCLDPKIVSDIIIEITSKFKVKENLVRNIITTKCADECKMLKLRLKNKHGSTKGFNTSTQKSLKEEESEVAEQ